MKRPKDMIPKELEELPDYMGVGVETFLADTSELAVKYGVKLGDTVRKRNPVKMYAGHVSGDDLVVWRDRKGDLYSPMYCGPDIGWAKQQIYV